MLCAHLDASISMTIVASIVSAEISLKLPRLGFTRRRRRGSQRIHGKKAAGHVLAFLGAHRAGHIAVLTKQNQSRQ